MKYDFWLDLPLALVNILGGKATKDEMHQSEVFSQTSQKLKMIITHMQIEMNTSNKEVSSQKLAQISAEINQLVCKAVKLTTILMTKLTKSYMSEEIGSEALTSIKIFSQITRLVVSNAQEEVHAFACRELFSTIIIFTEKVQNELYIISSRLIKQIQTFKPAVGNLICVNTL